MTKKKIVKKSILEDELNKIIQKSVDDYEHSLSKIELKEIISDIMPEIDKLISNKINEHFKELANYVIKNFK